MDFREFAESLVHSQTEGVEAQQSYSQFLMNLERQEDLDTRVSRVREQPDPEQTPDAIRTEALGHDAPEIEPFHVPEQQTTEVVAAAPATEEPVAASANQSPGSMPAEAFVKQAEESPASPADPTAVEEKVPPVPSIFVPAESNVENIDSTDLLKQQGAQVDISVQPTQTHTTIVPDALPFDFHKLRQVATNEVPVPDTESGSAAADLPDLPEPTSPVFSSEHAEAYVSALSRQQLLWDRY